MTISRGEGRVGGGPRRDSTRCHTPASANVRRSPRPAHEVSVSGVRPSSGYDAGLHARSEHGRERTMALLIVQAEGTAATGSYAGSPGAAVATPGNNLALPVIISVTGADGLPVTGLGVGSFDVHAAL